MTPRKTLLITSIILLLSSALSAQSSFADKVPNDWYVLPEDAPVSINKIDSFNSSPQSLNNLSETVQRIFQEDENSFNQLPDLTTPVQALEDHPKDWTPWHLELFTTELGLTAQGLIGILTLRGSAAALAYWRKQGPVNPPSIASGKEQTSQLRIDDGESSAAPMTLSLSEGGNSSQSISRQVEPVVRAAIATGQVSDAGLLRSNLTKTFTQLQGLAEAMDRKPESQWWVAGFRFDFLIEFSGKIAPVVDSVGTELRVRFDWRRVRHDQPRATSVLRKTKDLNPLGNNLQQFVLTMENVLEKVANQPLGNTGFKAGGFRVGVGLTANGSIGVAKGTGTAIGHINFLRDFHRPTIYPVKPPHLNSDSDHLDDLMLIDSNLSHSHLEFAKANGVAFDIAPRTHSSNLDQVVYHIGRERFEKGLNKAFKIGTFFANSSAKTGKGKWKVYEIRTSFDASIIGDLALVGVGGVIASQIRFINESF